MKDKSKLKEALIKALTELMHIELSGYIVYDGNDMRYEQPDYSKEKRELMNMIEQVNRELNEQLKSKP